MNEFCKIKQAAKNYVSKLCELDTTLRKGKIVPWVNLEKLKVSSGKSCLDRLRKLRKHRFDPIDHNFKTSSIHERANKMLPRAMSMTCSILIRRPLF